MNAKQAYHLMNNEIWCTCGGYTWRNRINTDNGTMYGEYLAYGDYPECIRDTNVNTYAGLKSIAERSPRGWRRWDPDVKLVIDLYDFLRDL